MATNGQTRDLSAAKRSIPLHSSHATPIKVAPNALGKKDIVSQPKMVSMVKSGTRKKATPYRAKAKLWKRMIVASTRQPPSVGCLLHRPLQARLSTEPVGA